MNSNPLNSLVNAAAPKPAIKQGDRAKTVKGQGCVCQVNAAGSGTYLVWIEGEGTMIAKDSEITP